MYSALVTLKNRHKDRNRLPLRILDVGGKGQAGVGWWVGGWTSFHDNR